MLCHHRDQLTLRTAERARMRAAEGEQATTNARSKEQRLCEETIRLGLQRAYPPITPGAHSLVSRSLVSHSLLLVAISAADGYGYRRAMNSLRSALAEYFDLAAWNDVERDSAARARSASVLGAYPMLCDFAVVRLCSAIELLLPPRLPCKPLDQSSAKTLASVVADRVRVLEGCGCLERRGATMAPSRRSKARLSNSTPAAESRRFAAAALDLDAAHSEIVTVPEYGATRWAR